MRIDFQIPAYAYEMLWLTTPDFQVQIKSDTNLVTSSTADIELRWGHPQGAPLIRWTGSPQKLTWHGAIQIAGHVECTHLLTLAKLDVMIIEITGNLRASDQPRLPSLEDLKQPFERSPFRHYTDPYWYAFLLPLDSPLADFAHQTLINGSAVECYGALADEKAGFHKVIGMPFLLDSMTLYP